MSALQLVTVSLFIMSLTSIGRQHYEMTAAVSLSVCLSLAST